MQGYKLTHIAFTPVMITEILHNTVQEINKEIPLPAATSTAELEVLPF